MKEFETYFSGDAIVSYLCKLRARVANGRNKKHLIHLLTDSEKFNYHVNDSKKYLEIDEVNSNDFIKYEHLFLTKLNTLFPSRKKWVVLGGKSRINKTTKQPLSASDRNYYSLLKTIKSFRKKSPNEPWLIALDEFILDIQNSVSSGSHKVASPMIYPKLKKEKQLNGPNECRPISLFSLKDRILLSITNKYLTRLFDNYFENSSYAFRSRKNKEGTSILTHHDCIKDVLEYRMKRPNAPLWVMECDMEKFYDSVNHKIIKKLFNKLIEQVKIEHPLIDLSKPSHIFFEFLNCYSFNKNVPLNSDLAYWSSYNIPNGEFEWIADRLKKLKYYTKIDKERIGVPQGGALSGLIANIVLDVADKEIKKTDVFYARFCDDMLIIHQEFKETRKAKKLYCNALKRLKLVPHPFMLKGELTKPLKIIKKGQRKLTLSPFWKGKSKGPYKWDSIANNGFPWIGFVGYEIHNEGLVRVRKKSFHKELQKQNEVIDEIRKAVKYNMRKSKGSVTESAIHRLIGMSVGRVTLKNYNTVSNDLCWKNGFKELALNKYSVQQIKQLDRNKNRLYYDLVKDLEESVVNEENMIESKPRQVIRFNKPFSYYYQVLERKENDDNK